jgi:hypothetical protein
MARNEAIERRKLGRKIAASIPCVEGIILSNLLPDMCLDVWKDITSTDLMSIPILQAIRQRPRLSHQGVRRGLIYSSRMRVTLKARSAVECLVLGK